MSVFTNDIPVYHLKQVRLLKYADGTPKSRLTTPGIFGDLSFFRIDRAVISPKGKQPESYFTLGYSESQGKVKAVPDTIILFQEELR